MLSVDDRIGSGELYNLFKSYGIKVQKTRLEFGDMSWIGNGPNGECAVVVERKRILDLVQSMQSRRLSGHQLPGMALAFDYAYLLVEGFFGPDDDGRLLVNKQPQNLAYRALDSYLHTMEVKAGLIYRRTISPAETVACVVNLYRWWTEKRWDEHTSHEAVYAPAECGGGRRLLFKPRDISGSEKVLMQLPGVDAAAEQLSKKFKVPADISLFTRAEWAELKIKDKSGKFKRFGEARAERLWRFWHG